MKVLELEGSFDENGVLTFAEYPELFNKEVKIIIMVPEDDQKKDVSWVKQLSLDDALDFMELEDLEEDFPFTEEGEAVSDQ